MGPGVEENRTRDLVFSEVHWRRQQGPSPSSLDVAVLLSEIPFLLACLHGGKTDARSDEIIQIGIMQPASAGFVEFRSSPSGSPNSQHTGWNARRFGCRLCVQEAVAFVSDYRCHGWPPFAVRVGQTRNSVRTCIRATADLLRRGTHTDLTEISFGLSFFPCRTGIEVR